MLNDFYIAYINDILIYSNSKKKYQVYVCKVFAVLQKAGLSADIDKCKFYVTEISYLWLIISTDLIRINSKKIETVKNYEIPTCIKYVQAFIGFANFYCRFIRTFSKIVQPMINIIKKNKAFC